MENIKVALVTADREYGKALGLALVDIYRNFTVTLFQSVPLHNELDDMDLVLADNYGDLEVRGKYIYLTEKNSQIDKNYDDKHFCLYKYSNVRQLAGELLFIYSNLTGRRAAPIRNVNAKIVVFGAAKGGVGCTSAAVTFAREMKRLHEKKVIYVSLEEIESTLSYMEGFPEGKSVSDYLYYLFNGKDAEKFPFLESYLLVDPFGVEAFVPSPGRNVMKSLSPEEMQFFIGAVLDTGGYDIMVIDAGTGLEKGILTCYEMANYIYMISGDESNSCKEERFLEYLMFTKGDKVVERIEKKVVSWDPESFYTQNEICFIKPEGKLGRQIKEMIDNM